MKTRWLNAFTVSIAISLSLIFVYSLDLTFIKLLELKAYDFKMSLRGKRPVSDKIVIVAIDEHSLQQEGRWPWPRTRLANLVNKLTKFDATVIGLDILFPEKDIYIPLDEVIREIKKKDLTKISRSEAVSWLKQISNSDGKFAEAILQSNRLVMGYFIYSTAQQAKKSARMMGPRELELLDSSQYSIVNFNNNSQVFDFLHPIFAVGLNIPSLMKVAKRAGSLHFMPDRDGILRFIPMVQAYKNVLFPPFSLQILKEATNWNTTIDIFSDHVAEIQLGDIPIPVTEKGDFLINYYGPSQTFTYISASDVINERVDPTTLKNKIVLVGATATALPDLHSTPFDPLYPGVEVHATVMENILNQDFLQRPPWIRLLTLIMVLITGVLLGWASLHFKAFGTSIILLFGIGGYLVTDYVLFTQKGLWVYTVYPVFSQFLIFSGVTLYRFIFEEREKRFIKGAFSHYLAPTVVNQLVENPKLLKLGGERKVLTAFFSDVAGFSSISEKMEAEELVDLLNVYLTDMTEIILKYEGTVDKYEGDAIIAFFGAPIAFEDHATRTCLAAMDMQKRLAELRDIWKKEGLPEMFMRIGINTGPMVVGNMGSINRMDYTMMGDSVNLAARLEGVNKQYKTYTMISEYTYELAKNNIETRELDSIRVVGRQEPLKIYEVLGKKGEINDFIHPILPYFKEGLNHYKNLRWERAIESFQTALNLYENDGPSMTYYERCITFQKHPPPSDWDGVFDMPSK